MKEITLNGSTLVTIVDDCDYDTFSSLAWYLDNSGYARRSFTERLSDGSTKRRAVALHREILGLPYDKRTPYGDHRNRNKLDNRRENLRICTPQENSRNRIGTSRSGYKGVRRSSRGDGWDARITEHGRAVFLGSYPTPEQAAIAYNEAALVLHGQYARLNSVPPGYDLVSPALRRFRKSQNAISVLAKLDIFRNQGAKKR